MLLEFIQRVGQVDHNTAATPRTQVALVAGEHLEVAAVDKKPDLDEIVAATVTGVCIRVAHGS